MAAFLALAVGLCYK